MATPILNIIDLPTRLKERGDLLDAKWSTVLDIGERWVNSRIKTWRSYVDKPSRKIADTIVRRAKRLEHTFSETEKIGK